MRMLRRFAAVAAAVCWPAAPVAPAQAQTASIEDLVGAVVRIKTFINPDGRSVSNLGREREGSGILIDENGLVLTIGYLMVEAHAAEVDRPTPGAPCRPASSATTTRPASACCARSSR